MPEVFHFSHTKPFSNFTCSKKTNSLRSIIITGCLFITTVNTIVTHNLTIYMNTKG